jgi:hypothetical protein
VNFDEFSQDRATQISELVQTTSLNHVVIVGIENIITNTVINIMQFNVSTTQCI